MYIEQNVFTYFLLTSYYCFLLTTNTVPTIEITQKKKKIKHIHFDLGLGFLLFSICYSRALCSSYL